MALLHSQLPGGQRQQTLSALARGQLRLLYLSPETLLSEPVWSRLCQPSVRVRGMILDEAHCLVQWGDTFRPAYRRLGAVRAALLAHKPAGTRLAIAAFTATADPTAQRTIQTVLQLHQPQTFLLNPYRANLALAVQTVWSPRNRRNRLLRWIRQHSGEAGLVYVRTRRASEDLAAWLIEQGLQTAAYHGGLGAETRRELEAAWLADRLQFVVCTSAFGMGINKPNVRWVVHFHAPALLSEYVQEVGRAGRDGQPSEALTLVSEPTGWLDPEDQQRSQFFQNQGRSQQQAARKLLHQIPPTGEVNAIARQFPEGAIALALLHSQGQLQWQDPFHYTLHPNAKTPPLTPDSAFRTMNRFLRTRDCRWQFLLRAFGFGAEAEGLRCGKCDRCRAKR